jgi:Lrp/AsnC family transcriptional regulator of lysine biosynthesis
MDAIDSSIIEKLKKDARTPFLQIAKDLKVSEGTIRKRVKDLINDKIIKKFSLETAEDVFAIVGLETETKTETKKIVEKIKTFGVETIYEVTGRFDIICEVPSSNMEKVNDILEKIRSTQGVIHTETFTVLKKN